MNANLILFGTVFIIILAFAAIHYKHTNTHNKIPKKIWTYWDNPDRIPKTVKMCMESWKKHNPAYEIVLLTKKNFAGYTTIPGEIRTHPNFNDSPKRFSEILRLWTLAEHGGIWIDPSTLLKAPVDTWLFPQSANFSGFYTAESTINKEYPVIDAVFFACNKGSKFIRLWRDEFSEIARYQNVEKYIESRKQFDFQKIPNPISQAICIAAQKVLQIDKYQLDSLILKEAEKGPLKYLVDVHWDSEKAIRLACSDKKYQSPIMMMRSSERNVLEKDISLTEMCGWLD